MENNIVTGSKAFFDVYQDFKPKDIDIVSFNDKQKHNLTVIQQTSKKHIFVWKKTNIEDMIDILLTRNKNNEVCMLLVPEVIQELNMKIELLPRLKPLIDNLDYKHKYLAIIYNSYIENNSFTLTDEQRLAAYEKYKQERPEVYNN